MKIFAGLAVAACMVVGSASAATFSENCMSSIGPPPQAATISCAAVSLGALSSITGYLLYSSDYTSGFNAPVTEVSTYSFTGTDTLAVSADTVTTTGQFNSTQQASAALGCTSGQACWDPQNNTLGLPPGFHDTITGGLSLTGNEATIGGSYSSVITGGAAQGVSGLITEVFTYTVQTTGSPEPVSMVLFGSGLLAFSLIGRKKFARK
jgi:hypothetical protein